jgi:hypothetical protein
MLFCAMSEPRQKDVLDIVIDFFFGALAGGVGVAAFFSRRSQQFYDAHWQGSTIWISLLGATLISGSLAALYRNQFWSSVETYSVIPPMEETVSKTAKIILWILFAIGCGSFGLLALR